MTIFKQAIFPSNVIMCVMFDFKRKISKLDHIVYTDLTSSPTNE